MGNNNASLATAITELNAKVPINLICRYAHAFKLTHARTRNDLFWAVRDNQRVNVWEHGVSFSEATTVGIELNSTITDVIRARGFFTLGLDYIDPSTEQLVCETVEFSAMRTPDYNRYINIGKSKDFAIEIPTEIIHSINGRGGRWGQADGHAFDVSVYTPVLFDKPAKVVVDSLPCTENINLIKRRGYNPGFDRYRN